MKKTLETFNRRIEKDSKDADAWVGKGNSLMNLGKWEEARDAYNRAIEIDPQDYHAWGRKAGGHRPNRRSQRIGGSLRQDYRAIPSGNTQELSGYWMSKAEVLAFGGLSDDGPRTDLLEEAVAAINHSLELDPKSSSKWHFKATILSELDRRERGGRGI